MVLEIQTVEWAPNLHIVSSPDIETVATAAPKWHLSATAGGSQQVDPISAGRAYVSPFMHCALSVTFAPIAAVRIAHAAFIIRVDWLTAIG